MSMTEKRRYCTISTCIISQNNIAGKSCLAFDHRFIIHDYWIIIYRWFGLDFGVLDVAI